MRKGVQFRQETGDRRERWRGVEKRLRKEAFGVSVSDRRSSRLFIAQQRRQ